MIALDVEHEARLSSINNRLLVLQVNHPVRRKGELQCPKTNEDHLQNQTGR